MSGADRTGDSGSYTRKRIEVAFTLGQGETFDGSTTASSAGSNVVALSGLRCSAAITKAGGVLQGALDLRVYGMTAGMMNRLSQVGAVPLVVQRGNTVTVSAGAEGTGMAVVYQGTISAAFPDYENSPEVPFRVLGITALDAALMPMPPSSYRGAADAAVVMADLARRMGYDFENAGVSGVKLRDPYFPGSAYQQAETCAQAAGVNMAVEEGGASGKRKLVIWPRGGAREGTVPVISPESGMVGYPVRTPLGVEVTTLWNPAVRFAAKVEVRSPTVPQANGVWQVGGLDHALESETPDGLWYSKLSLLPIGFTQG